MTVLDARPAPLAYGTARLLAGVTSGRPADLSRHREHHGEQRFHDHADLAGLADQVRLLGRGGAAFPVGTQAPRHAVRRRDARARQRLGERAGQPEGPHPDAARAPSRPRRRAGRRPRSRHHPGHGRRPRPGGRRRTDRGRPRAPRRRSTSGSSSRPAASSPARCGRSSGHWVAGRRCRPDAGCCPTSTASTAPRRTPRTSRPSPSWRCSPHWGRTASPRSAHPTSPAPCCSPWSATSRTPASSRYPPGCRCRRCFPTRTRIPVRCWSVATTAAGSRDVRDLTLTRPSLRAAGLPLNAGVVARLSHETCALGEVAAVSSWLAGQSAGQCGPCFFGLPAVARDVHPLLRGQRPRRRPRAPGRPAPRPRRLCPPRRLRHVRAYGARDARRRGRGPPPARDLRTLVAPGAADW